MAPIDLPPDHFLYRVGSHKHQEQDEHRHHDHLHQQHQQQHQQQLDQNSLSHGQHCQPDLHADFHQDVHGQDNDPSSISYHHYSTQPYTVEAYYPALHHAEFIDYGSLTPDREDFEGGSEILTRPRLTKEQVEVLEAQFQAHHKPNSNVKRQLALQTKLTLPRVAVCLGPLPLVVWLSFY
jgi:hypothetical protein